MKDKGAKITGAIIGLGLSGYILIFKPMSHNFSECGKVTLCHQDNHNDRS